VEQGTRSRPEPVKAVSESAVKLKSIYKNGYVCLDASANGAAAVRAGCAASAFLLVDLGNGEAALRDPASGRYLGVAPDGKLYPVEASIGTWEIFRLAKEGGNIALQSKKTGAYVKPAVEAAGGLAARGALDGDAWFAAEPATVDLRGAPGVADELPYAVVRRGTELAIIPARGQSLDATLADTRGRLLARVTCAEAAGCTLRAASREGIGILTVRSGGVVRRLRVAAPRP
jgi:hypothetical protein